MASQKKLEANRRNPLRHGLLAQQTVLPEENLQDYLDLLASFEAEYQPAGPTEKFLVHEMASAQWRLQRLTRIETGFLRTRLALARKWEYDEEEAADPDPEDDATRMFGRAFAASSGGDPFAKLARYENTIRRAFYKALNALEQFRRHPRPPAPAPAPAAQPLASPGTPNDPEPKHPESASEPAVTVLAMPSVVASRTGLTRAGVTTGIRDLRANSGLRAVVPKLRQA